MKYILLVLFISTSAISQAQKFALLDMQLLTPIKYTNTVTSNDKFNKLFPVEKKMLPQFVKALKEIEKELSSTEPLKNAKSYEMGCIKFTGLVVPLATSERIDYVVTSTCDNVRISLHLCESRLSRSTNAFLVKTWIKYITSQ